MRKDSAKAIFTRVKGYFRENWGAPLIIGFMFLLMITASFLTIGLDSFADELAIYAYYALVAGVVLQLVCFLKYGEMRGNRE